MADSIRDALTQAFEAKDLDPTPAPEVEVPEAPATTGDSTATVEDSGETEQTEASPSATSSDQTPGQGSPPQAPAPAASSDPAPASWKAEEKAAWNALPPAAKAAIKRREADTLRALNTSSEARKRDEAFNKALAPYQEFLGTKGVKDVVSEVVAPILEIRRVLETGTPDQRALMAFNIIKNYGIDVNKLDSMLVDGPGNVHVPQQAPPLDPRAIPEFAPLFEIVKQVEQAKEAQIEKMIGEVSSEPHFEELREDIAEVLSKYAARGQVISMRQAYDRALLLRPDLAPAAQATPASQVTASQAASILAKSRNAASTVAGAPRSSPGKKPDTLRGSIEAAFQEHG